MQERAESGWDFITPQNSALLVIDYEPTQLEAVRSMDHDLLVENAISPR